jgi:hypothetical protein
MKLAYTDTAHSNIITKSDIALHRTKTSEFTMSDIGQLNKGVSFPKF